MRRTRRRDDDDDYDEIGGTKSIFPLMCRWFPSSNCRQGFGCMFAHSVSELHLQARWGDGGPSVDTRTCVSLRDIWKISLVVFLRPLASGSHLFSSVLA